MRPWASTCAIQTSLRPSSINAIVPARRVRHRSSCTPALAIVAAYSGPSTASMYSRWKSPCKGLAGLPSPLLGATVGLTASVLAYGLALLLQRRLSALAAIPPDALFLQDCGWHPSGCVHLESLDRA